MAMSPDFRLRSGGFCGLLVISFLYCPGLFAQDAGLDVRRSRDTGLVTFVTSKAGGPILVGDAGGAASVSLSADQFLDRYGRLFGVSDRTTQLVAAGAERDALGQTHLKFKQVHLGVPVYSGQLRIHQDAAGRVLAANGDFYDISPKLDVRPALTADAAAERAMAVFEAKKPQVLQAESTIVDPGWYGDPPTGARLAYLVELEDPDSLYSQAFFVDANSGKILDQWSLVEHFRSRQIHDGMQTTELPGLLSRGEGGGVVPSSADVNRAYDYYGDTYDYFFRAFGRDSMDNQGVPMVATVNSIAPGCPNAFWSSSRLQMAFCTGTVTDDITAHELTHGVTYFTAGLVYQNQSGQLNESYSDVFGELVDLFNGNAAFALGDNGGNWPVHPTGPGADQLNSLRTECSPRTNYFDGVRWLMGEDAFAFGGAIRDMWDPTCSYDPDRAMSPLQTCGPGDNGGVHSGSGVPNHAFAMLVDGKQFNGFSVRGIGPIKAGAVWYRALVTYLNPTSDFEDAYVALTRSAQDLVGQYPLDPRTGFPSDGLFTADDAVQVDLALRAVEMNGPGLCGKTVPILNPDEPPKCGNELLIYADDFESGAPGWTVSNSAPLTPYDWQLTTDPLPFGRTGRAWLCDNSNHGDCANKDESGSHSLFSPPIELPRSTKYPLLRFTHHMDVESGWDGGTVSVRTSTNRRWVVLRASSFHFNSYNTRLRNEQSGNTNPLAGREAWSGIGGQWGTSVVDLSGFARGGETIEIRFDFGKDGCTGRVGWFVDDVEVVACGDCNFNGHSDDLDLVFRHSSGALSEIGAGSPRRYVLDSPPPAGGDVTLAFYAIADLAAELQDESLFVSLNGEVLGEIFAGRGTDCPSTPDTEELVVSREQFNEARVAGAITIEITATDSVNPRLCGNSSWVRVDVEYATQSDDADSDYVPDECQSCETPGALSLVAGVEPMNRYVAFVPSSGTRHVAYRVQRTSQAAASSRIGADMMWLGPPIRADESGGFLGSYARLQCEPYFASDWGSAIPIYLLGEFIIPSATYRLDAIEVGCWSEISVEDQERDSRQSPGLSFSKPITLTTSSLWGDLAGSVPDGGPDGKVDMLDVSAVVDGFRGETVQALHPADLSPAIPDRKVDFADISQVVNAYHGMLYPFPVTAPSCPNRTP
jgi:bacillolysin